MEHLKKSKNPRAIQLIKVDQDRFIELFRKYGFYNYKLWYLRNNGEQSLVYYNTSYYFDTKEKALQAARDQMEQPDIEFVSYNYISEQDINGITGEGIEHTRGFIPFEDCTLNFAHEHGGSGHCIGERNIEYGHFLFCTKPRATMLVFEQKSRWRELFSKVPFRQRFHDFQKKIIDLGYSTYDMT